MEAIVDVKLQATCGCGVRYRIGDGVHFLPKDVVEDSVAHSSQTGHKMEMAGSIVPPPKPVFIADKPKDRRRYHGRDPID